MTSIDDLGGAKPGDKLILHAGGAHFVERNIISQDWSHPRLVEDLRIREGSMVTIVEHPAGSGRVYLDIPRGNLFASARHSYSTREDLFSGRGPEKQVPSRRER